MPALPLVLASGSPRRRQLLIDAGIPFEVVPPGVEELDRPGEAPAAMATRLAAEKALAVAERTGGSPERFVLGADTIVVVDEDVLGKPENAAHAVQLLERILGREHTVITGVAVVSSAALAPQTVAVSSRVTMRTAERSEVEAYVATGEPLDKAGAYGLQGEGRRFVLGVEGSQSNVIGLPVEETRELLKRAGWS